MKKIFEKLKFAFIVAAFAAVVIFAFSFFTCGSVSSAKSVICDESVALPSPLQMPLRQSKIQGRLLRGSSASVSSNRYESSSNPPLNRCCSAWFERTYIEIAAVRTASMQVLNVFCRKKHLENFVIARAGPCRFSVTA